MKKFVLSLILGTVCSIVFAQDTITYQMLQCDHKESKSLKASDFKYYLASDGHVYREGDTILLGAPSTDVTTAMNAGGGVAVATTRSTYSTIVTDAAIAGAAFGVISYMKDREGDRVIITNIKVARPRKAASTGATINLKGNLKGVGGINIYDFEKALSIGEIRSQGMSRERAVQMLKKAKEELDLDIISQEEYNKLKEELLPWIKK
ncbi:MAG: hypothetical protein NC324_00955 [Bacteroides sp.]|nr:hypothetical protein [Bacteroides sp.]